MTTKKKVKQPHDRGFRSGLGKSGKGKRVKDYGYRKGLRKI